MSRSLIRSISAFLLLAAASACGSTTSTESPDASDLTDAGNGSDSGPTTLAAPADLRVESAGSWGIGLMWSQVTGATAYNVYAGPDASSLSLAGNASINSPAFRFSPVTEGATYVFRVAATADGVEGEAASISYTLVPAAPANVVVVSGTQTSLELSWDAVAYATSYVVQRCAGSCTNVAETAETHATVSGLTAGQSYSLQVLAKNAGGESPASARAFAATVPVGPAIGSFEGETANSVTAVYEDVDGAAYYVLEIALAEVGPYFPAGTTVSPFVRLTAAGLRPGETYFLRVRVANGVGASVGPVRSYTMGARNYGTGAAPPTPIGLALEPGVETMKVTWTGTYTLYTNIDVLAAETEAGPFVPVAAGSANGHSFEWNRLTPGTRYCVALASMSVEFGGPQYSAVSAPACATTLARP